MFYKSLVATTLMVAFAGAANAEWTVASQENDNIVMVDQQVGVSLVVAEVGSTAEASVKEVAVASAQQMGCSAPGEMDLAGIKGQMFECQAQNQFVFIFDDEDGKINMFTGVCDSNEKCEYVGQQIGRIILAARED